MLLEEYEHCRVEYMHIFECAFLGALALVVQYGRWYVVVFISLLQQAVGEVYVLAIHKECLVEGSAFVECAFAGKEKGARYYFYLGRLLLVEVLHIVFPECLALGEERAKAAHLAQCCPGGGQAAARFKGERTVGA